MQNTPHELKALAELNPLAGQSQDKQPETVSDLEKVTDESVKEAIRQFDCLLSGSENYDFFKKEVLTPQQISLVSLYMLRTDVEANQIHRCLNKMVNLSFEAGHNDFYLSTGDSQIESLCFGFKGKVGNRLRVQILGNVAKDFSKESRSCQFTISGNAAESYGCDTEDCDHIIKGNVARFCGFTANGSRFTILGNAANGLGEWSRECSFILEGDIEGHCGNITEYPEMGVFSYAYFATHNPATYEKMKKAVYNKERCTVELLTDKPK